METVTIVLVWAVALVALAAIPLVLWVGVTLWLDFIRARRGRGK